MPTVDERMNALLAADLDVRERERLPNEAHPRPPRHDPNEPWTAEEILHKLAVSDVFLERSLMVLYARQTSDERSQQATVEVNGVGFNRYDAGYLTSLAEQVRDNAGNPRSQYHTEGQRLSPRQRTAARNKLKKYVRQLVDHANRNRHAARTTGVAVP